jgi:hypothetical protein
MDGRPSGEAVGLSGQTLLRVQRNELEINSQLKYRKWNLRQIGHSVKHLKVKSKVETLGHELPRPLDLHSHSVKLIKAKPKVQTQRSISLSSLLKITPPI